MFINDIPLKITKNSSLRSGDIRTEIFQNVLVINILWYNKKCWRNTIMLTNTGRSGKYIRIEIKLCILNL